MKIQNILKRFIVTVFANFGFAILVLLTGSRFIGSEAKSFSPLFALGSEGLPSNVVFMFFLGTLVLMGIRFLFLSDAVIRSMQIPTRVFLTVLLSFAFMLGLIIFCGWFPKDTAIPWIVFAVSFIAVCIRSTLVSFRRIRKENEMLTDALHKFQNQGNA